MRLLIDSLEKGTIDEAEYEEITGEKYKAETKAK